MDVRQCECKDAYLYYFIYLLFNPYLLDTKENAQKQCRWTSKSANTIVLTVMKYAIIETMRALPKKTVDRMTWESFQENLKPKFSF